MKKYLIAGFIIFMVFIIVKSYDNGANPDPDQAAIREVHTLVMENVVAILERLPNYYFSGTATLAPDGNGYIITDEFQGARWLVVGLNVWNDNGLATGLTPNLEYSPPR